MVPDSVFYPAAGMFVVGFLFLWWIVERGFDRVDEQSPGCGAAIGATWWLIVMLIGTLVVCWWSVKFSGG